ncbi:hypothetical protein D5086_033273 [Populus alba]|uniref:Uncharacterized protein n=1 Tax=Populus alba TaxID=43335 RepID=A0ACC4AGF1_POPAL
MQSRRLPMVNQVRRGTFSQGSWIGEMQQASDKSVIIIEILDPRTKNLLSMSKISDYVLSNELVSMALAMVAEDQQINDVLEELFADEGNELQIRQADLYLSEGEELSFYEVLLRARQRREIVIGYRAANAERAVINPPAKTKGDARRLGLNADLVKCWLSVDAQPIDTVRGILMRAGLISPPPMVVMGQKKGPAGETSNPEKSITL